MSFENFLVSGKLTSFLATPSSIYYSGLENNSAYCFANALLQCLASLDFMLEFENMPAEFKSTTEFRRLLKSLANGFDRSGESAVELFNLIKEDVEERKKNTTWYGEIKSQYESIFPEKTETVTQQESGEFWVFLQTFFKIDCFEFIRQTTIVCIQANKTISIGQPLIEKHTDSFVTTKLFFEQDFFKERDDAYRYEYDNYDTKEICPYWSENEKNLNHANCNKKTINPKINKGLYFIIQRSLYEQQHILDSNEFLFPAEFSFCTFKYRLKGVTCHFGNHAAGHYIAFGMRKGHWYKFNDARVDSMKNFQELLDNAKTRCTQLFYERD